MKGSGTAGSTMIATFADGSSETILSSSTNTDGSFSTFDLKTSSGTLNSVVINSGSANSEVFLISSWYADGKILVDTGVRDLGDTTVSTTTPKQGEGTISDITGSVVTINPVVDNCFVNNQYLLHTAPKPIKITPKSEAINSISTDGLTLTLAGNEELIEFAAGDPVTMCNADGTPAVYEAETSTIISAVDALPVEVDWTSNNGWNGPGSLFRDPVEDTQSGGRTMSGGGTITWSPLIADVTKFEVLLDNNIAFPGTHSITTSLGVFSAEISGDVGKRWETVYSGDAVSVYSYNMLFQEGTGGSDKTCDTYAFRINGDTYLEDPGVQHTDVSGTIVFPAPEEITLTFTNDTNLEYFRPGDEVQYDPYYISGSFVSQSTQPANTAGSWANVFNGVIGVTGADTDLISPMLLGETCVFTPSTPIPIEYSLKIYSLNEFVGSIILNDNVTYPATGAYGAETEIFANQLGGYLRKVTVVRGTPQGGGTGGYLHALKIDNRLLVDPSVATGITINQAKVISTGYPDSNTMVVDGGNWDSSNQSQVWTDEVSLGSGNIYSDGGGVDKTADRIFDGDPNTTCIVEKGTASSAVSLVLAAPILNVTKIRVKFSSVDTFYINTSTTYSATVASGWETIYEGTAFNLNTLKIERTSNVSSGGSTTGFNVDAIEINDRPLVDAAYDGEVWSLKVDRPEDPANPYSNIFDGDRGLSNPGGLPQQGTALAVWEPDTPIVFTDTIVWKGANGSTGGAGPYITVDGVRTDYSSSVQSQTFEVTIPGGGTLTQIEWGYPSSSTYTYWNSLFVDGKQFTDKGVRDLGDTTAKTLKSGSGVVGSVNVETNTMTLSSTNSEWVPGYYVSTPEKNAVEMRGYLIFDADGGNVDLSHFPQQPVLMNDKKTPTITFPTTFSTGEGVDTDLPYPTYLEVYATAGNELGLSARTASNVLYPDWTGRAIPAAGSYRVMTDEFGEFCYWACSSDYRAAIKTVQNAENTVQQLRTMAENMANNFLGRENTGNNY